MFRIFLLALLVLPLGAGAQDVDDSPTTVTSSGEKLTFEEWKKFPEKVRYTPGAPVPEIYLPKRQIRKAPFIVGVSLLGGAYFVSTAVSAGAAENGNDALLPLIIPVAGPYISAWSGSGQITPTGRWFLLWDGLIQTTGLGLMVWGLVDKQDWLIKKPYGFVQVTPVVGPEYAGAVVQGQF